MRFPRHRGDASARVSASRSDRAIAVALITFIAISAAVLAQAGSTASAPEVEQLRGPVPNDLPEAKDLVSRVRANLHAERARLLDYTWLEHRQQVRVSKLGKVWVDGVRVFEVYPQGGPDGGTYKRLIAERNQPLTPELILARDEQHRARVEAFEAARHGEPEIARAERERRLAARLSAEDARIDDVLDALDVRIASRESLDGRPALRADLLPRRDARPKTAIGRYVRKLTGTAWIDETTSEVTRVQLDLADTVLLGWGFLGHLDKGSRAVFERRFVEGAGWLPTRMRFLAHGRTLLVRRFDIDAETVFTDYKRFTVETTITTIGPR